MDAIFFRFHILNRQIWLNFHMDDQHFSCITKIKNQKNFKMENLFFNRAKILWFFGVFLVVNFGFLFWL